MLCRIEWASQLKQCYSIINYIGDDNIWALPLMKKEQFLEETRLPSSLHKCRSSLPLLGDQIAQKLNNSKLGHVYKYNDPGTNSYSEHELLLAGHIHKEEI